METDELQREKSEVRVCLYLEINNRIHLHHQIIDNMVQWSVLV
jgi:hypothetical protein